MTIEYFTHISNKPTFLIFVKHWDMGLPTYAVNVIVFPTVYLKPANTSWSAYQPQSQHIFRNVSYGFQRFWHCVMNSSPCFYLQIMNGHSVLGFVDYDLCVQICLPLNRDNSQVLCLVQFTLQKITIWKDCTFTFVFFKLFQHRIILTHLSG